MRVEHDPERLARDAPVRDAIRGFEQPNARERPRAHVRREIDVRCEREAAFVERRFELRGGREHRQAPAGLEDGEIRRPGRGRGRDVIDDRDATAGREPRRPGAHARRGVRRMRERLDRDHEIERPVGRRVVAADPDVDAAFEVCARDAGTRDAGLLVAQREPREGAAEPRGEVDHRAAEAAARVEHVRRVQRRQRFEQQIVQARRRRPAVRQRIGEQAMHRERVATAAVAQRLRERGPPCEAVVVSCGIESHAAVSATRKMRHDTETFGLRVPGGFT